MDSGQNIHASYQPDSDVHISYEDQQKINIFAKRNARMDDLKEELKMKQHNLKNLEDACNEIALMDNDERILYRIGDLFVTQNLEKTQVCLEEAKQQKINEIILLENKCAELKNLMADLKSQLYSKFGSHINLETEED